MSNLAEIGHNNPPDETPFDLSRQEIEDLFEEAKHWLDGAEVASQDEADQLSKLIGMIREAVKTADARRKEENKPFDEGKTEVQARYNPLIQRGKGKADLALDSCKKALAPFLQKQENEKRARAEAARREADEKAKAAQDAIRATNAANLAEREKAEALLADAKKAETIANRAEKDKARAKGGARATTLRTTYTPQLTDAREAARHYWVARRERLEGLFLALAAEDIRAGTREIPGFKIVEEKKAV